MAVRETKEDPKAPPQNAPRIEHVNLFVTELDLTARFLMSAFPHWRVRGEGGGDWYGAPRRWAHIGDDDNYLTLNEFNLPKAMRGRHRDLQSAEPGLAHIGFEVTNLDTVVERLADAGYEPAKLGEDHPHRRNLYYINEEGLEFEFVEYSSAVPSEKNLYQ
ncbi:VOC family protein [Hyphococcus luteus]|uniref:Glyoxalase n=1 Tax=Hyphococcus luteus TaxID=2058213 RepID=A0A2S7K405_9PROT|nr:VOC family protein [Marinicaulis flavus]PQA87229.1 glyoxalase [Marinicaulis flavus]